MITLSESLGQELATKDFKFDSLKFLINYAISKDLEIAYDLAKQNKSTPQLYLSDLAYELSKTYTKLEKFSRSLPKKMKKEIAKIASKIGINSQYYLGLSYFHKAIDLKEREIKGQNHALGIGFMTRALNNFETVTKEMKKSDPKMKDLQNLNELAELHMKQLVETNSIWYQESVSEIDLDAVRFEGVGV